MAELDLKKLNRKQLLELLLKQTHRADALQRRIDELEEQLAEKKSAEKEAGTLAEEALRINGVFEAADKAAKEYAERTKKNAEKQAAQFKARMEQAMRQKLDEALQEAEVQCRIREAAAEEKLRKIEAEIARLQSQQNENR